MSEEDEYMMEPAQGKNAYLLAKAFGFYWVGCLPIEFTYRRTLGEIRALVRGKHPKGKSPVYKGSKNGETWVQENIKLYRVRISAKKEISWPILISWWLGDKGTIDLGLFHIVTKKGKDQLRLALHFLWSPKQPLIVKQKIKAYFEDYKQLEKALSALGLKIFEVRVDGYVRDLPGSCNPKATVEFRNFPFESFLLEDE